MKYTDNLNLRKPEQTEFYNVDDFNENADILDAEIQGIKNTFVKSVNGKEPDAGGNVNVEEYTHPNSGVTAGTYRSVTVNAQGHVTGGSNPTLAIADGGTGATTASQARVNLGLNSATGLVPTGTIIAYAGSSIPSGYLACNGAAVSRTTYSALWSAIGTAYGAGNGSSTFNLPNLEDNRFMEFHSTPAIKKDAGLPDHTHTVTHYTIWASGSDGMRRLAEKNQNDTSYPNVIKTTSKASANNSIYGSSTTVQPKSLTVRAIIKY